jgi:hypothetical protein
MAGGKVCSVPLIAMAAERSGRSCRMRLRIASPVRFWTSRLTASAANTKEPVAVLSAELQSVHRDVSEVLDVEPVRSPRTTQPHRLGISVAYGAAVAERIRKVRGGDRRTPPIPDGVAEVWSAFLLSQAEQGHKYSATLRMTQSGPAGHARRLRPRALSFPLRRCRWLIRKCEGIRGSR